MNRNTIWSDENSFEASDRGSSIEFDKSPDGGFRVGFDIGRNSEVFHMTAEQFAAFKKWVMEN